MGNIYQIILNLAILIGVFILFRKIYILLTTQANQDNSFIEVEKEYKKTLENYKKFGLPKFIYLYAYEEKKKINNNLISDVDSKEIDTIELVNEIKSFIPSFNRPFFFFHKKFSATKKQSINLIISEIKNSMLTKFPNENQVAIVIINDDILYFIHEPNKFYAGASDKINQTLN